MSDDVEVRTEAEVLVVPKGQPTRIRVTTHAQMEWSLSNCVIGQSGRSPGTVKERWAKTGKNGGLSVGIERDLEEGEDAMKAIAESTAAMQSFCKERTPVPGMKDLVSGKLDDGAK